MSTLGPHVPRKAEVMKVTIEIMADIVLRMKLFWESSVEVERAYLGFISKDVNLSHWCIELRVSARLRNQHQKWNACNKIDIKSKSPKVHQLKNGTALI